MDDAWEFQEIDSVEIESTNTAVTITGIDEESVKVQGNPAELKIKGTRLVLAVRNEQSLSLAVPYGTEVRLEATNRKVVFLETRGIIRADLDNAEVLIYEPGESVKIENTNGRITLVSQSGTVDFFDLKTTNAPINIGIAPLNARLWMETDNGRFQITNLPFSVRRREKNELEGFFGNGSGGDIRLQTTNNGIFIQPAKELIRSAKRNIQPILPIPIIKKQLEGTFQSVERHIRGALWELGLASSDYDHFRSEAQPAEQASIVEAEQQEEKSGPGVETDGEGAEKERIGDEEIVEQPAEPLRVVVFPFREINRNAKGSGLGEALSEMLITSIANQKYLTVIERSQIDKVIEEHSFQLSGVTDEEESVKIGNILNAEILILGSVSRFGERIELDVRVINGETGEILLTRYGSSNEDSLREMVNELGTEISEAGNDTVIRRRPVDG